MLALIFHTMHVLRSRTSILPQCVSLFVCSHERPGCHCCPLHYSFIHGGTHGHHNSLFNISSSTYLILCTLSLLQVVLSIGVFAQMPSKSSKDKSKTYSSLHSIVLKPPELRLKVMPEVSLGKVSAVSLNETHDATCPSNSWSHF